MLASTAPRTALAAQMELVARRRGQEMPGISERIGGHLRAPGTER